MDTLAFLATVFQYSDNNIYLWTLPGKRTYPFAAGQIGEMAAAARKLSEARQNVYFGVCTTAKALGEYERPKNDEITGLSALWVDIDIAGDAHAAQNLPPDVQSARALLPPQPEPSIIVHSGHGLHAYYLLREEWPLDTADERRQAAELVRRLQGAVRMRAAARGWHLDSVGDLSRVLRLPGTWNFKEADAPALCQVIEASDPVQRYNVSDFDELPEADEQASQTPGTPRATAFERRPTDGPAAYMMANCKFLQHWQLHYKALPEPVWMAACTNLIRGVGGEEMVVAAVKDWLGDKYSDSATYKKIEHWFNGAHPTTCAYIRETLQFAGCDACGIKAPCCWSLEKTPQALAHIREIAAPDASTVYRTETLGALALLEKTNAAEYAKFREKCRGRVNLNDLAKAVKQERLKASQLQVIDGGQAALAPGQTLGEITTRQSVPDTPLDLAIPAGFAYGPQGVEQVRRTDSGDVRYSAAGAPVIISERIYNVDSKTEKIQLSFQYFGRWASVVRRRSEVFSARSITALTDYGLNTSSESAKYLVKYLQALEAANPAAIPLCYAVSKIGWREQSLTDFVIPGNTANYRIDMEDEGEVTEAFTVHGEFAAWKELAAEIRRQPFARFVLAAAFATPLLKICKNRNFMIFFWGTSGGGKTASQLFALTVWGSPARLMKSFYGTQNGLEKALAFSNDFPMVINEKQVMNGRDKQDLFEQLVYMLEGGRGKVRASKTGLQKTSTWRSIGMASGEEPLSKENSIQGVKTRLLELNVYPVVAPDAFAKSLYAAAEEHHGHAGPAFVARLVEEAKDGYAQLREARDALAAALRRQFPSHFGVHIDNVALVALADCLYSQWLMAVPPKQAEQEAYELACAVLEQLPTERQISDVERGWDFVQNWLAANDGRFERPAAELKITPSYGFKDTDCTCIFPEFLTDALRAAGFSPDKLLREFANKGRILTKMEGGVRRLKIQMKYKGSKIRAIKIPIDIPEM